MIKIKIPFKTPSINHLHGHNKWGVFYLKPEAKKLKEEINNIVQEDTCGLYDLENSMLKVNVEIHENWFCKNGTVKRADVANREKFLIDAVFDAIGINDKFIFEHTMTKVQDDEEFALIMINALLSKG